MGSSNAYNSSRSGPNNVGVPLNGNPYDAFITVLDAITNDKYQSTIDEARRGLEIHNKTAVSSFYDKQMREAAYSKYAPIAKAELVSIHPELSPVAVKTAVDMAITPFMKGKAGPPTFYWEKFMTRVEAIAIANEQSGPCFPGDTLISLPNSEVASIKNIKLGNSIVAFSEYDDPCDANVETANVARLFHNITEEWSTLVLPGVVDQYTGQSRQITSTPGHVFLSPDGQFRRLCDMIDTSIIPLNSDALAHKEGAEHYRPIGMVEIVLEDGTIAKAEAHSIKYSAATAHLYEEAEMLVTRTEGGLAVKPEMKKGWKTYNFEVAEHHTYIADGGNPAANDNFRGRAAA